MFEARPASTAAAGAQPAILRATDLTGVHVLKHEDLFVISNRHGDIRPDGRGLGLYVGDTRFLSTYDLLLNGLRPVVLLAGPAADYRATLQLTNPDTMTHAADEQIDGSEMVLQRQSLGVVRRRIVAGGFAERIEVTNYTTRRESARLSLELDADFADIFEIRGVIRPERGRRLANVLANGEVTLAYRGLDGIERRTHISIEPAVEARQEEPHGPVTLSLQLDLPPGETRHVAVDIWTEEGSAAKRRGRVNGDEIPPPDDAWQRDATLIETGHPLAQKALERATRDLHLLANAPIEGERYIAAGVPWFSCLFGRDSIITALQLLTVRPQVARSTLRVLGRLQARDFDTYTDAQPGKILHELRSGELARTGEIPHTPYYGSVDATPLWLMLFGQYERWTADRETLDELWPNALAALRWIDEHGDLDGDGFVEYERHSERGLLNQGWKDSADAIRFADGRIAHGPIALVEVQAYVYAARLAVARLARSRGDDELSRREEEAAERLRQRFEDAFWLPQRRTYALALDGDKRPVDSVTSNPGHALWAGIASPDRASAVAESLTSPEMWSGWGIRTLSRAMGGYNPIGYHLGTVWPHDNAICAAGFSRYGMHAAAQRVASTILDVTSQFAESRLPELFCGFDREESPRAVPYPVACSPQAWAAGSLFHIISASLGLQADAAAGRLELLRPALPDWLPTLQLRNLRVGDARVDLAFAGSGESVSVEVLGRSGHVDVVVRL